MRLESLTVSGFRGFAEERAFDLSADVILVHGPNGSGKTSLFDAILWAVTGSVERLGPDADLVSRYASFGEARVELTLRTSSNGILRIVRRFDGKSTLTVDTGGQQAAGAAAEALLLDLLWPEAKSAPHPGESLSRSVTRAVYLQQDQVRSFLEAEDEQSRFAIVAEIVGAGRVGELVRQLETSRKAWSTASNRLREEVEPLVRRRDVLRSQVAELSAGEAAASGMEQTWLEWVRRASVVLRDEMPGSEGDRTRVVERCLESLRRSQRRAEQILSQLREFMDLLERVPQDHPAGDLAERQTYLARAEEAVAAATAALVDAEARAADLRQRQVQQFQDRESLAALAQLALRHLGERCPVCTQDYDHELTQSHLESLLDGSSSVGLDGPDEVQAESERLRIAERELAVAQSNLRETERTQREFALWEQQMASLAGDLQISASTADRGAAARSRMSEVSAEIDELQEVRRLGEGLTVSLARISEFDRLAEYRTQLASVEAECGRRAVELALRDFASSDAKLVHESLRQVGETLVGAELERIEPLVQRIYSSVDPHPSFRAVRFLTETKRGRGHLWTSISDSVQSLTVNDPKLVLSSSQLNVLAVVAFLALNLSVPTLPLQLVALDDPLQSLDNVNLLGLSDLLRRLRRLRQVIVSTHDERLAGLLERKLRPVLEDERTTVIRVDAWSRTGPVVSQLDVPADAAGLRLVASA